MRNFLTTFVDMSDDEEDFAKEPFYIAQLKIIHDTEMYILDVNCDHIFQFD